MNFCFVINCFPTYRYSSKTASKISFITPWDHKRYIAGLDKNIQINLPIKVNMTVDYDRQKMQVTVKPLYPKNEVMVFHFSSWPYTTKHDILDLVPVSKDRNTEIIHVREPKTVSDYPAII